MVPRGRRCHRLSPPEVQPKSQSAPIIAVANEKEDGVGFNAIASNCHDLSRAEAGLALQDSPPECSALNSRF